MGMRQAVASFAIDLIALFVGYLTLTKVLNHFVLAAIMAVILMLPDLFITRVSSLKNGRNVPFHVGSIFVMLTVGFTVSLLLTPGIFGMSSITGAKDPGALDAFIHAFLGAFLVAMVPALLGMMRPKTPNTVTAAAP
jgi:hypothetical protein